MNKTLITLALIAAASVLPASARGPREAGLQLGVTVPGAVASDGSKTGPVFGAHYYEGLRGAWGVLGAADFFRPFGKPGSEYQVHSASLSGIYNLPAERGLQPFLRLGLTYNWTDFSAGSGTSHLDIDRYGLGLVAGGGINKRLSESYTVGFGLYFNTFAEIRGELPNAVSLVFHIRRRL